MAYDELLADRIRQVLKEKKSSFNEKNMFGGICFMVNGKMCIGVIKNDLMARVNPEQETEFLNDKGVRPMDFTRRPMKGYVYVDANGTDMDEDLEKWVDRCLAFNPLAKSSKKTKKK
ncbi:TfoX/Sxy family protein [uncultured Sunxiuqinia sp.]|uniref:TfoX/Sxy family protein n=1 Tax=uncultured Sunxiuqinia sp. TaxID=1573825 RepID=UPI002AA90BA3|nr:TfoX/Sxy family protein [uncultured Sunxiuqinia sp.]